MLAGLLFSWLSSLFGLTDLVTSKQHKRYWLQENKLQIQNVR
jgi:hypothetical protein